MSFTKEQRTVDEPILTVLNEGVVWLLTSNFLKNSSFEAERLAFPLGSFEHNYYCLAKKQALEFIAANKLRLKLDISTPKNIRMLVYNPDHPSAKQIRQEIPTEEVEHNIETPGEPCFYCGLDKTKWTSATRCPAFTAAMMGAQI